jgi:hypothetical protein
MRMSESIAEIAKALAKFQTEVKQPEKSGENPHFKSKYVTLDGTVKAIHECAPNHGLSYIQSPLMTEDGVGVTTLLMHSGGEFIEFDPFILPLDRKNAQGAGSAITYARRYSLSAAFGIVSDLDDDGNEAAGQNGSSQPQAKPITSKQVGLIKTLTKKLATGKNVNDAQIYEHLKVNDITKLSAPQASKAIETLNKWIEQMEQQGA